MRGNYRVTEEAEAAVYLNDESIAQCVAKMRSWLEKGKRSEQMGQIQYRDSIRCGLEPNSNIDDL